MSDAVDAARDILRSTRPPAEEWKLEREIRETTRSDVEVPSRQEAILENLRTIRESRQIIHSDIRELIELVDKWPDEQLEEVRTRLREMAGQVLEVLDERGGSR